MSLSPGKSAEAGESNDEKLPRLRSLRSCACPRAQPTASWVTRWTLPARAHLPHAAYDEGRATITNSFVEHMFRCLDCRACETACPSGVQFGHMMEDMRGEIVKQRPATGCRGLC
jgi:Fe-S oxidoreductase